MKFSDYLSSFSQKLPGVQAHIELAPRLNGEPVTRRFDKIPPNHKEAAVVLLLNEFKDLPELLLVLRKGNLKHHANEWGFPGGQKEPGESLMDAALRELYEETRIKNIELVKKLSPIYIPVSGFRVFPYVFTWKKPEKILLNPDELIKYKWITPDTLFKAPRKQLKIVKHIGKTPVNIDYPAWEIGEKVPLWGATAMMTNELLHLYENFRRTQKSISPDPAKE